MRRNSKGRRKGDCNADAPPPPGRYAERKEIVPRRERVFGDRSCWSGHKVFPGGGCGVGMIWGKGSLGLCPYHFVLDRRLVIPGNGDAIQWQFTN